jgi:hypothetical protein
MPEALGVRWAFGSVDQLRPGLVLGCRLRLLGPVGGGPGSVWRAVDETSGRDVTVKTLRGRSADGDRPGFGLAFATVTALSNPGIAQIHHYGEEPAANGRPAISYLVRDAAGTATARPARLAFMPSPLRHQVPWMPPIPGSGRGPSRRARRYPAPAPAAHPLFGAREAVLALGAALAGEGLGAGGFLARELS